ncbi:MULTISPECIES: winged helix-turn-helix domain-containing protein [Lentzea]|uniref:Helix-turn-helix domain-containing protein n=1 Tax=Lentzea jiangxiensis TaxID=641025 RepID=A0A1H0UJ88_9PSEU|nr:MULTISPECIES: helix-turn-helix domain-containing protein [Lentzea]WVH82609.1 helix-turn-helix domain-containing protein [Lentzea sp. DG1S-22]SDP66231.1 Helix-turn-helix domain-containing protein [Lentzea jiangxiensis]
MPRRPLPDHPVRVALLDLLAEHGTLTSTQAAARLGESSGLCSFHLRRLAELGLIEEAPHRGGKARPWQLRWETDEPAATEESFSALIHVTPEERAEIGASIQRLLFRYRDRGTRPEGAVAVTAEVRLHGESRARAK